LNEEEAVIAIILVFVSLLVGGLIYVWMVSAGLPNVVAAPIGMVSFLVVIAALFGITGVVVAAIKVIGDLLD